MARPKKTASSSDDTVKETSFSAGRFARRGNNGLYSNIDYKVKPNGKIDWRAMVDPDSLYVNKAWFERKKEDVPESIEGLSDDQLIIRQWGLRDLMKLRGFLSHTLTPVSSEPSHVSCISTIRWLPNIETDMMEVETTDFANASILNCDERFSIKFLESIAANRALVRNIRNFLGIYIVGEEELDGNPNRLVGNPSTSTVGSTTMAENAGFGLKPADSLRKFVTEELSLPSFGKFYEIFVVSKAKEAIIKSYPDILVEMESWTDFDSISPHTALLMLRALKKQVDKNGK